MKIKKSRVEIYVADFETSHETRNGVEYAWVWCAGYSRLFNEHIERQGTINEFVKSLMINKSKKVYFHNLKFDGQFLLSYFLNKGYTWCENFTDENQLNYIIDNSGTFYSLQVSFKNKKGQIKRITFLDSLKIYPYSLATVAKQFGFEEQKGKMDYDELRYPNHKLTQSEIEYFRKDIVILRKAMEQAYLKDIKKMTIGANALYEYKTIIGKNNFDRIFPKLPNNVDEYLRNAYKGGCCMVGEKYQNVIADTYSYDINSMYPSQLKYQKLPFGVPHYFTGKYSGDKLYVQHLKASFNIKNKKLPCIQLKHTRIFQDNEWIKNCNYQMELYLTNIDLDLFFDNYDVYDLEYIDGYEFESIRGLFSEYIDKWYNIKMNTHDKGERAFAKLFLNNIYGKFGTNPHRKSGRFGLINGVVKKVETIDEDVDTVYLPIAIFTTSYARAMLIKNAQTQFDDFMYCDTDSIHFNKPAKYLKIDNHKLGFFKYEYKGVGKHLKQKTYIVHETEDGEGNPIDVWNVTCAGLNKDVLQKENIKVDFEMFKLGAKFNKLKMKKVIGGCYLSKEEHTIK